MLDANLLLDEMIERSAVDLYITAGLAPAFRTDQGIETLDTVLDKQAIESLIEQLLTPEQRQEFEADMEFNSAYNTASGARFRLNVFRQKQEPGMVIRRISTTIPLLEDLNLPKVYQDLVMESRGLVLVVGATSSGKSSSLAAMLGYRNRNSAGHIITIEDPVEFIHDHAKSIITQRDVGIDTVSFGAALKNALRQRPDVVLIGEIRDREAMEHAINFSETGHLCLATLHSNNASQTVERILSFFPEDKQKQVYMNLALNLRAVIAQRLVPNKHGTRSMAAEIMLNQGLIKELIEQGNVREIRDIMARNFDIGMQTFDQALLELVQRGDVSEEVALAHSDNPSGLKLDLKKAASSPAPARSVNMNDSPLGSNGDDDDDGDFMRPQRHYTLD